MHYGVNYLKIVQLFLFLLESFGTRSGRKLETVNSTKQLRVTYEVSVVHSNNTEIRTYFQSFIPVLLTKIDEIKQFMLILDEPVDELFTVTEITLAPSYAPSLSLQPTSSATSKITSQNPTKSMKHKKKKRKIKIDKRIKRKTIRKKRINKIPSKKKKYKTKKKKSSKKRKKGKKKKKTNTKIQK